MTARSWVTPSYCAECHRNHPGPCGCWCHRLAAARAPRLRDALPAIAAGVLAAMIVTACGPASGSPGCPPGQWHVKVPGSGWTCASDPDPGTVFTPASTGSAP